MTERSRWAKGPNQYKKRLRAPSLRAQDASASPPRDDDGRVEYTGITWRSDDVNWDLLERSGKNRVRARYRASLPEYVWDAAVLEGNPYTLPEVQTLLEGITVEGHTLEDQEQILSLNLAYNRIDELVAGEEFHLDKATSDRIHADVAVHEAIESGHFRGEGHVGGGGTVNLGAFGIYRASEPGPGGEELLREYQDLLDFVGALQDPREQAIAYFCAAARRQFYFDGNKRTSRLMMAGHLMSHGYDAISISARRRIEFNEHLITLFDEGSATALMRFIVDNRPEA